MTSNEELIAEARARTLSMVKPNLIDRLADALEAMTVELKKSDAAFSDLKRQHAAADIELVDLKRGKRSTPETKFPDMDGIIPPGGTWNLNLAPNPAT